MIPETNGTCPHCGKKLEGWQANQFDYGSPIVTCKSCGKRYLDRRYHEIAVEGFRGNDLSLKRDGVIALTGLALFVIAFVLNFHMAQSTDHYSLRALFVQIGGLVLILIAAVDAVMIVSGAKAKRMEKKKAESVARLRNLSYAQELESLGYPVPDEYL